MKILSGTRKLLESPKMIESNNIKICLHCDIEITEENDSGWEAFTEDGVTTQPICKACDEEASKGGEKASEITH